MAPTPTTSQIPHHVNALLSHLTSRPGVQSTFILSRKDGSIIQSTGLFASPPGPSTTESTEPPTSNPPGPQSASGTDSPSEPSPATIPLPESRTTTPQPPYQPSQAEALAAHIVAFVNSATNLSASLSHPPERENGATPMLNGVEGFREDGDAEGSGKEEDGDDVKLLRFRSKKHEVVVVPDRKYILCVVHGAASAGGGGGAR